MVIIVHSAHSADSIRANIGMPDYSYYFVLKKFRSILESFATVLEIRNPLRDPDILYKHCLSQKEPCLFLSFTPPFKTVVGLQCPTISVFAWEFLTIPTDVWNDDERNDWRYVFRHHGQAITHSSFAVNAVRKEMGDGFPIWSIPAPAWDQYVKFYRKGKMSDLSETYPIEVEGTFIDLDGCEMPYLPAEQQKLFTKQRTFSKEASNQSNPLYLGGIVYTAVFNPSDRRKNWEDMVKGYIWAFRNSKDVTLLLKVVHHDFEETVEKLTKEIYKLTPFSCRLVILHGYLNDDAYAELVRATTYIVNTAYGEGQCLPLMEFMSAGKPAIAPAHSAMEDYIHEDNAFVVQSSPERASWPDDPSCALRTLNYRINWESLYRAFLNSHDVAVNHPELYSRMADCAVESLKSYCSRAVVEERLKRVFRHLGIAEEALCVPDPKKRQRAFRVPLAKIKLFQTLSRIRNLLNNTITGVPLKIRYLLKRRIRNAF